MLRGPPAVRRRQPLKPATLSLVTTFTGTFTVGSAFLPRTAFSALSTAILPDCPGCWATYAYSVPSFTAAGPSGVPSKPK